MMLIDTSAWIEFFRSKGEPRVKERVAAALIGDEAAYTCPVLMELLVGARDQAETDLVRDTLGLCARLAFKQDYWEQAARIERAMRRRGVIVPRDDILVATVARELGVAVLCRDAHFSLIRDHAERSLRVDQV